MERLKTVTDKSINSSKVYCKSFYPTVPINIESVLIVAKCIVNLISEMQTNIERLY